MPVFDDAYRSEPCKDVETHFLRHFMLFSVFSLASCLLCCVFNPVLAPSIIKQDSLIINWEDHTSAALFATFTLQEHSIAHPEGAAAFVHLSSTIHTVATAASGALLQTVGVSSWAPLRPSDPARHDKAKSRATSDK